MKAIIRGGLMSGKVISEHETVMKLIHPEGPRSSQEANNTHSTPDHTHTHTRT